MENEPHGAHAVITERDRYWAIYLYKSDEHRQMSSPYHWDTAMTLRGARRKAKRLLSVNLEPHEEIVT